MLWGTAATAFEHFAWGILKVHFIELHIRGLVSHMQSYSEENKPDLQSLSHGYFPSWLQMSAPRDPAVGWVCLASIPSHLSILYDFQEATQGHFCSWWGFRCHWLLREPQGWLEHRWLTRVSTCFGRGTLSLLLPLVKNIQSFGESLKGHHYFCSFCISISLRRKPHRRQLLWIVGIVLKGLERWLSG